MLDAARAQTLLDTGNLEALFIEELGWDHSSTKLHLTVDGQHVNLVPIAQKRELGVFEYKVSDGQSLPTYAERAAIETAVAKLVREHLIIFSAADRKTQVWQWAKREIGRPIQRREHTFQQGRRADLLIQKLGRLIFTIKAEEDGITVIDVAGRLKAGFDVAPITKRFYDGFQAEHKRFLARITGIRDEGTKRWYASIMLNRLMFIYFIQEKGFLDGDPLYLQTKLRESASTGKDRYLECYLFPLFFECLSKPLEHRAPEFATRIGTVPFLNGGLFELHQIEIQNPTLCIPDEAFSDLFSFFGAYRWHLDERPISDGNEINPDVLGYIFERYINQAQMGAYYTKEDITEYMATFAILPRLLSMIGADAEMSSSLAVFWQTLRDDPDRYIFPAMRYGMDVAVPADTDNTLHSFAPREFALESETWYEMLRRRQHVTDLRNRIAAGTITTAADCIRENLNLRQLLQDVLERSADERFLEAAYDAVTGITILDPACGSGAFLFAAMKVLEPIYEACLDKMSVMIDADHIQRNHRLAMKFAAVIQHATHNHPNLEYYILKQLALHNLYGVDIMEEAVEICKLRLFLKLIAQVDRVQDVEPLPDLDFNVHPGNSLIGFSSMVQLETLNTKRFDFANNIATVRQEATNAASAFDAFRNAQTDPAINRSQQEQLKTTLRTQLEKLELQLNEQLARQYAIDTTRSSVLSHWRDVQQPFHWLSDFFGIMSGRRFDVVIGNPPYVMYPSAKVAYGVLESDYSTLPCKNLYALMFERALELVADDGVVSFIVQLTVTASERVLTLQKALMDRGPIFYASFPRRPQAVFEGVEMPVTIVTSLKGEPGTLHSTRVERFSAVERVHIMTTLVYLKHRIVLRGYRLAKMSFDIERAIYEQLTSCKTSLETLCVQTSNHILYYQEACRYWVKVSLTEPYNAKNGIREFPAHWRKIALTSKNNHDFAFCLMNSSLFYWYYSVFSDTEHVNDTLVKGFPIPSAFDGKAFEKVAKTLDRDLRANAHRKTITTKTGDTIAYDQLSAASSKALIDEADALLAEAFGLTDAQLDFIVNYDAKYRLPETVDAS